MYELSVFDVLCVCEKLCLYMRCGVICCFVWVGLFNVLTLGTNATFCDTRLEYDSDTRLMSVLFTTAQSGDTCARRSSGTCMFDFCIMAPCICVIAEQKRDRSTYIKQHTHMQTHNNPLKRQRG